METNELIEIKEMQLPDYAVFSLYKAARWAKMLAIVSFIMLGLAVVGMLLLFVFVYGFEVGRGLGIPEIISLVISIAACALGGWLAYLLLHFSQTVQLAIQSNDNQQLVLSFNSLHKYFLIQGILVIVAIGIMALSFFISLFGILL